MLGEFYWPVERGQQTDNRDFSSGRGLLSMEKSDSEVTWSSGDRLPSRAVAAAFGLQDLPEAAAHADALPVTAFKSVMTLLLILFVIIIVLVLLTECSGGSGGGYTRSSGGSWGGYSSGGGHK